MPAMCIYPAHAHAARRKARHTLQGLMAMQCRYFGFFCDTPQTAISEGLPRHGISPCIDYVSYLYANSVVTTLNLTTLTDILLCILRMPHPWRLNMPIKQHVILAFCRKSEVRWRHHSLDHSQCLDCGHHSYGISPHFACDGHQLAYRL